MKQPILDVIVIGAGQAGLNTSYFLKQNGLSHIVFERGKIGESWRSQRWDSFRVNTSNRFNLFAGEDLELPPDEFCTASDFAAGLDHYATKHQLPVLENTKVAAVEKTGDVFNVTIETMSQRQTYFSRQVIVASGAQNEKKLPAFAGKIDPNIQQLHASEYRNAQQLHKGAVLVAGAGQSGVQIVEDLLDAGRKVFFSTSLVARIPRTYRGRDIMGWLLELGFFDTRPQDVKDPAMLHFKPPQLTGVGGDRTISYQMLAKKGAVIVGKTENAENKTIYLQLNAANHIRFADNFSKQAKAMVDEFIERNNLPAPPAAPDEADMPDAEANCATDIPAIDLAEYNINSIIWATGFNCDFSYIKLPVLDAAGMPVHENGSTAVEGLYFVGLPWLRMRKSLLIYGAKDDAEFIVSKVLNYADAKNDAVIR